MTPRTLTLTVSPEQAGRTVKSLLRRNLGVSDGMLARLRQLMLTELRDTMAERGMTLAWDDAVVDALVKKSFSETYGARNLRRLIQKEVEDAIAAKVVERRAHAASVRLTAPEGAIEVTLEA